MLVDSEPIANRVLVDMANEFGAGVNMEYAYKHFKGNSLTVCLQEIEMLVGKSLPSDFEKNFRERSFEAFSKEIKPVEGIEKVLENLEIPFCLASSGPLSKIKLNLTLTGLHRYFEERIFSCYTLKKWKPDPDIFLWAATSMGFQAQECVVIEDSNLGIVAARRAGMDVFGYTARDYNNDLKNATLTFNKMTQLINLLHGM